jgi:hypothetical protein
MKKNLEEVKIEKIPELPIEDIQEEENLSFKLPDRIEKINEMVTIINEYK